MRLGRLPSGAHPFRVLSCRAGARWAACSPPHFPRSKCGPRHNGNAPQCSGPRTMLCSARKPKTPSHLFSHGRFRRHGRTRALSSDLSDGCSAAIPGVRAAPGEAMIAPVGSDPLGKRSFSFNLPCEAKNVRNTVFYNNFTLTCRASCRIDLGHAHGSRPGVGCFAEIFCGHRFPIGVVGSFGVFCTVAAWRSRCADQRELGGER